MTKTPSLMRLQNKMKAILKISLHETKSALDEQEENYKLQQERILAFLKEDKDRIKNAYYMSMKSNRLDMFLTFVRSSKVRIEKMSTIDNNRYISANEILDKNIVFRDETINDFKKRISDVHLELEELKKKIINHECLNLVDKNN